ncbi:altronate dehydratase family protein [Megasphaera paucivorans]|uniref:Altronate hydrolase n=1 Tax=Megasphaera paucivorans TaxID=349095 RepID=A0A1G9SDT5_9FIRM|nr:altronate dehydratase family protein [Megasphaera paucivorans]SDM33500.1 altronate hydrolase [Megasphaera paucivorans]
MADMYQINEKDNVAVAAAPISKGTVVVVQHQSIVAGAVIPAGHKMAIRPIAAGEDIIKYGFPIGAAREAIAPGAWVHTHNMKSKLGNLLTYTYEPDTAVRPELAGTRQYEFLGYPRKFGKAGIRNEVWIIPTVGCVNAIARAIEEAAQPFKTAHIDGIFAYSHPHGCSQLGEDHIHTQKILSGLVHSPNAGAVLVLGLGCENNQIDQMKAVIGEYDPDRVKFLVCQEVADEVAAGTAIVEELCRYADQFERVPCDASQLTIGLKCGGSDGLSGITANPLVGEISNRIIAAGGTSILTEVPEMFGAETLLMNRARNRVVFDKIAALINHFKEYFMRYGEKINENPSPGNKAGGITTLEDKSLGCVQKGGQAIIEDVLAYGDRIQGSGLQLLQAPGNDLVAANALAAAGADMVLFTTGRGTPFACPVPTIKISSNSPLAAYKKNWIDFDAEGLIRGESMEEGADRLMQYILDVASGKKHAKSEKLDKHDLAIFKDGVTL